MSSGEQGQGRGDPNEEEQLRLRLLQEALMRGQSRLPFGSPTGNFPIDPRAADLSATTAAALLHANRLSTPSFPQNTALAQIQDYTRRARLEDQSHDHQGSNSSFLRDLTTLQAAQLHAIVPPQYSASRPTTGVSLEDQIRMGLIDQGTLDRAVLQRELGARMPSVAAPTADPVEAAYLELLRQRALQQQQQQQQMQQLPLMASLEQRALLEAQQLADLRNVPMLAAPPQLNAATTTMSPFARLSTTTDTDLAASRFCTGTIGLPTNEAASLRFLGLERADSGRFGASTATDALLRAAATGWPEDSKVPATPKTEGGPPGEIGGISWDDLVADSYLTEPDLRGVVSDLHFAVMAQMKPCVLTHEDRVGLYKNREIGFPGMCCKHCNGVPGFGRYFPGSLSSLVNGNICKSITKHLQEECRKCPPNIRAGIDALEREDQLNPFYYKRGSRRQFFGRIWRTMRMNAGRDPQDDEESGEEVTATSQVASPGDSYPWDKILEDSEIVTIADRHLVPDTIFAATAQTKPCQVTEGDRVGRCKDHALGSMGLCCKHCEGKPGAYGRYFPSNLHTFAQVEVCKQIVKHITRKCPSCPPEIRSAIVTMQEAEESQQSRRYPSRMVFFRRVWHRFHYGDAAIGGGESKAEDTSRQSIDTVGAQDIPWTLLLKESQLVSEKDKGLISDSQFAAIAQMDSCELTQEDKIGYNKNRDIGFVGLRCRYCGGKPGFGRYFPNNVRNFEKTSARDTIVSHISLFCQECPKDIRNALLSLKRIESSRDGSTTMKGLMYGSGKMFFRRVWSRLHGTETTRSDSSGDETKNPAAVPGSQEKAQARSSLGSTSSSEPETDGDQKTGKGGSGPDETKKRPPSGSQPTTNSKRRK